MRMLGALALVAMTGSASAQWTTLQLPERVYTSVPFTIEAALDCPEPGEVPPPIGCNGTTGVWFEASDHSAFIPSGFVTLFPFFPVSVGPFTFHKPGRQVLTLFHFSREFPGEIEMAGQVEFVVQPPSAGAARRK